MPPSENRAPPLSARSYPLAVLCVGWCVVVHDLPDAKAVERDFVSKDIVFNTRAGAGAGAGAGLIACCGTTAAACRSCPRCQRALSRAVNAKAHGVDLFSTTTIGTRKKGEVAYFRLLRCCRPIDLFSCSCGPFACALRSTALRTRCQQKNSPPFSASYTTQQKQQNEKKKRTQWRRNDNVRQLGGARLETTPRRGATN